MASESQMPLGRVLGCLAWAHVFALVGRKALR